MTKRELKAIFHGKVQGVGFRWVVVERAEEFGLSGTVANLPDGTVEVHVIGEEITCKKFIESLQKNSGFAKINKIDHFYLSSMNFYSCFKIK